MMVKNKIAKFSIFDFPHFTVGLPVFFKKPKPLVKFFALRKMQRLSSSTLKKLKTR
jgi:hypothetical protein